MPKAPPKRRTPAKGTADDPIIHQHTGRRTAEQTSNELKGSKDRLARAASGLAADPSRERVTGLVWATAEHLHISAAGSPARDQAQIVAQGLRYLQLGCALDGQDLPLTRAGLAESTLKAAELTLRQALSHCTSDEQRDHVLAALASMGGEQAKEEAPLG